MYSEMFFGGSPGNGPECSFCNLLRDGIKMFEEMFLYSRIQSVNAGYRVTDHGFVTILNFDNNSPSLGLEFIRGDATSGERRARHDEWMITLNLMKRSRYYTIKIPRAPFPSPQAGYESDCGFVKRSTVAARHDNADVFCLPE